MFNLYKKRNNNKVTFIFGIPRSGTTWLWSLLESHSDVLPFLINVEKDEKGLYEISETAIYLKSKKPRRAIQNFANKNPNFRIIEKTPYHTFFFNKIILDFPESKNILILRNPLSVVNSMINSQMKAFENHNIKNSCNEIMKYYQVIKNITKSSNVFVITYEDLIDNTQQTLLKIFDYLELEISGIKNIISENTNNTKVNVKGVFRKGEKESYMNDLSKKQIESINELLKSEIIFYQSIIDKL